MKAKFHLHIKSNGAVRATKTKVATYTDEVTIAMEIDVPDRLFEKPIISGKITIDESMVSPKTIEADVKEHIEKALSSVEGVKIELVFPETEN